LWGSGKKFQKEGIKPDVANLEILIQSTVKTQDEQKEAHAVMAEKVCNQTQSHQMIREQFKDEEKKIPEQESEENEEINEEADRNEFHTDAIAHLQEEKEDDVRQEIEMNGMRSTEAHHMRQETDYQLAEDGSHAAECEEEQIWGQVFIAELERNRNWGKEEIEEPRRPLRKNKMSEKEILVLNEVVRKWGVAHIANLLDVSNVLYSVGKTVEFMKAKEENMENTRSKVKTNDKRNRTLRKLDQEIKENKRIASWAESELQRRRERRRPTRKEKVICHQLAIIGNPGKADISSGKLRELKVKCVDMIHMLQLRRSEKEKTVNRRKNNGMFETNEKGFYRKMEKVEMIGKAPSIETVHQFWSGIWGADREEQRIESKWMKEVENELKEKIHVEHLPKLIEMHHWKQLVKKRKNWTSPGPDGVQNYWIKKISVLWRQQVEFIANIQEGNTLIDAWMGEGRTVLIPKTNDRSKVEKYRPITCLNALYKLMTAVIANDIQEYLIENSLWDMQQKGTRKGILGTMDNLLVDRAVIEEAKQYERNLAVSYYDYEKAYDSTPHAWQIQCFKMCRINEKVINLVQQLHTIWRTRLELCQDGKIERSPPIKFKCGFFQGDSFSPVGFCVTEIPLGIMLERMPGYMMGAPKNRNTKVNRFYFIDDLKVVQGSEADLKRANSIIGKVSEDMGMRFGISKCAEIVYERGKMVKGEGLDLKEGTVKALNPENQEFYTFLGIEEGEGQMDKLVKIRVTEKCFELINKLCSMQLYERNLVKSINCKAMATVRYSMSICHYTKTELKELDIRVRRILKKSRVRGPQESVERLYMAKEVGGRGLTSFEMMYKMTKISIAVYLCLSEDEMLKAVFNRERSKTTWKNPVREAEIAVEEVGHILLFEEGKVVLDGKQLNEEPSKVRKMIPQSFKKWWRELLIKEYENKVVKSVIWKEVRTCPEGFSWMQRNLTSQTITRVLRVQEQMVANKGLDRTRGKPVADITCRLCKEAEEGVKHWLNACQYLAKVEYLKRHDQTLRVFYAEVLKKYGLEPTERAWFNIPVEKVRESPVVLVMWNMRVPTHTRVVHRWPDLRIEDKLRKTIWIVDMSCPSDGNVIAKEVQKIRNYMDLSFELRMQRPGWKIVIMPLIVGVTGAINKLPKILQSFFLNESISARCTNEMQKTTVLGSLQMIHRVECKLV
jgi:hypothetical protein